MSSLVLVYRWRTSHRKALAAVLALRPHVLIKGPQFDKVIAYYAGKDLSGRYARSMPVQFDEDRPGTATA